MCMIVNNHNVCLDNSVHLMHTKMHKLSHFEFSTYFQSIV